MLGVRPLSSFPLLTLPDEFVSDTAIVTVRYATHSFVTGATDSPANTQISGRINSGLSIARTLRRGPDGQFGSILETTFGELRLNNADGALDPLARDYYADGRAVRVKIGAKEVTAPTRIAPQWIATGDGSSSGNAAVPYQLTYPADGIVAGDLFEIQVTINDRGAAGQLSAVPAGWEVLDESSSGVLYQAWLYRFATGDEAGQSVDLDWESGDGANDCIVGRIHQYRYVDPVSPWEGLTSPVIGDLASIGLPTVITTVPNCLARYAVSWSDNVVTNAPSGAVGGTWASIGAIVSTSTGDDAANRRGGAVLSNPGTISGGSISATPTDTPVSDVSLLVGASLRGLPVAGGRERVQAFSAFATVYQTVAGPWRHSHDELILKIQDLGAKLKDRKQILIYSGTGGKNGTADLAGRTRPLGFGAPSNVTLQLVDPANFIFQASSSAIFAVDAVFDRGAELTAGQNYPTFDDLAAATVSNGTYATCLAEGYVAVGGGADPGSVTANIRFDESATHASTILRIVQDLGPLVAAEIDDGSFDAFAAAQPAEIGIFFPAGDESTVEDAVERIAFSGGAFAGQDRSGLYRVQRIEAPAMTPQWVFDDREIVFDGDRRMARREPPYGVPWKSWGLGYDKNWTVQDSASIAAGVDAERKIYLGSESRFVYGQNAKVAVTHKTSRGVIRQSLFLQAADAATEAARLSELYGLGRAIYEVPVKTALFSVRIGETVRLTYPRWGLNQGRNFVVIGANDDGDTFSTDLVVFG